MTLRSDDRIESIRGTVAGPDGAPLPEVQVILKDPRTGEAIAECVSTADGGFQFDLAAPGFATEVGRDAILVLRDRTGAELATAASGGRLRGGVWDVAVRIDRRIRDGLDLDQDRLHLRPTVTVGGMELDACTLEELTQEDLCDLARQAAGQEVSRNAAERIRRLSPELDPRERSDRTLCGTPILTVIEEIRARKDWPRDLALRIDEILRGFDRGFATATHECANFIVTYQTSGSAAVDPDTSAADVVDPGTSPPVVLTTLPAGGPPTYIKRICFWLERALSTYTSAPFSMKNPAAAGKIPVVVNASPYGSASPTGTFYLNNALDPDLLCAVAVHELFHMVQYEYGLSSGDPWRQSIMEGGAVFAEDTAADKMNRYVFEASSTWSGTGVLVNPNRSLVSASYDACLFWRYIAEQQSADVYEPLVGVETYRRIIEEAEASGAVTSALRTAVRALPWYQDLSDFHYLDPAKLDRTNSETVLGNYALALYLKDLGTNVPDRRFDFLEDEEPAHIDSVIPGVPAVGTLASVATSGTQTVTATGTVTFSGSVNVFGSRYYELDVDPSVTNVDVQFTASSGLTDVLFQIALIDEDGAVRDLHRTDSTSYGKRLTNLRAGKALDKVLLVVTGCESSGSFTIHAQAAAPTSDVMVTRWHSKMGTEYEIDSRGWAWTWVSPDVWVDNDGDGVADSEVYFDFNNQLHVRLHNKGNADASGIGVQFYYQDATGGLSDTKWLPVRNTAGTIQSLSGLTLAAGASGIFSVDWSPVSTGTSDHFCIRAIVTSPGDANTDNKRVLSNFGNVKVRPGSWIDLVVMRRNILEELRKVRIRAIPRVPIGLELSLRDLREQEVVELRPGEARRDLLRVTHTGDLQEGFVRRTPENHKGSPATRPTRIEQGPDPRGFYATDADALPPGIAGKPMVTLVHEVDGLPVGGVTLAIHEDRGAPAGDERECGKTRRR